MSELTRLKKVLICSTALIGGGLVNPSSALAVSCPSTITGAALANLDCDFDTGSSVTVTNGSTVGAIRATSYNPSPPSFIANDGSITSTAFAGIALDNSSLSNGITNTGTIDMPLGQGIAIFNTSTISGGITNSGSITGGNQGIYIETSTISSDIHNTETGHITGTNGAGMFLTNASFINGDIVNDGTITGGGNDTALGILGNTVLNGDLLNTGTIQATDTGAGVIVRSALISGGITNSGHITSVNGRGLDISNVSTISDNISNSSIISGGSDGISVRSGSLIGGLINSGTISGGNNGFTLLSSTISGALSNSGTISGGSNGIYVSSATITGGISNSGTIQGGTNAIQINSGSTVSNIDLLGGSRIIGAIDAANSTVNILGGTIEGNVNANQVNIDSNFTSHGGITANNVSIGNSGTFTLRSSDTVTGDVTANGGTFALGVGNGTFGQITGMADLSGGQLAVHLENTPLLHDGDQMHFAATVVAPSGAISDNSYLYDFQLVGNAVRAVQVSGSNLGFNRADTSTYNVLQAFVAANTGNADILQVLGNLNSAGSRAAAQSVLQSVEPTLNGSDLVGAQTLNNHVFDITHQQLAMVRNTSYQVASLGDLVPYSGGNRKDAHAWGQFFGSHTSQDERGGISGYSANTWGGVFGMDTRKIHDDAILGVAFGYGKTNADSNNSNHTDTDVGSYQLTVYGDYTLSKDTFITGMVSYGRQNVDTTRYNVGGTPGVTARGSFDTNQYSARAELGKNFAYRSAVVTPSFVANYLHYSPDGYTESGAGGANLTVDRKNMNILEFGPSVNLSRAYQREGGTLTPSVHGGLRYDVIGDSLDATNTFAAGGPAFDTKGIRPGRATVDMGAGLTYQTIGNWELTANYDFQYKSDYTSNTGFLRAIYKF